MQYDNKQVKQLRDCVEAYIKFVDRLMKSASTHERGMRQAAAINALDMQLQLFDRYGKKQVRRG